MESKSRSSAAVLPLSCFSLQRSLSPNRHFRSPHISSAAASNSPSAFNFSVSGSRLPNRYGSASYASSSINFELDRSVSPKKNLLARSPGRSVPPKAGNARKPVPSVGARRVCMCSPSNHPGSFRCSLHRNSSPSGVGSPNSQLHMRRSAMKNSLVRIGSVEGEWVQRALTALIRPSNHQMRRRTSFQPQPSRLCHMTRAEDVVAS